MKKIAEILSAQGAHWVGDGFPVRTLFSYDRDPASVSPFLLFDYAGPRMFDPASRPRGVGQHPHRGFETVTIVYDGEVAHKDSTGAGGVIGPGDVQWMTAARGVIHEEFHSPGFTKAGGPFRMVQLWVNLPAKDKMTPPRYQAITSAEIPVVPLAGGSARIIAGEFRGARGAARTFTPRRRLPSSAEPVGEAEIVRFEREGADAMLRAEADSLLLVLTGEPIAEPVVGHGPFVMNTEAEIRRAFEDYRSGRFGAVAD